MKRTWRTATTWIWGLATWAWVLVFAVHDRGGIKEGDVFMHVMLGDWIRAGGNFNGDPTWTFGYANPDRINTLVIPEVVFSWLYQHGGWGAISLLCTMGLPLLVISFWWAMHALAPTAQARRSPVASRIIFLASFTLIIFGSTMSMRPQTVSYILTPLLMVVVLRALHTGRFPHPLPAFAVTAVWTNWHGYGLFIAPLLAAAGAGHVLASLGGPDRKHIGAQLRTRVRRVLPGVWTVLAAFAGTLLTPVGFHIYQAGQQVRELAPLIIVEWRTAHWAEPAMAYAIAMIAVWAIASVLGMRRILTRQPRLQAFIAEAVLITGIMMMLVPVRRTTIFAGLLLLIIALYRVMRTLPHHALVLPFERIPTSSHEKHLPAISIALTAAVSAALLIHAAAHTGVDTNAAPTALYTAIADQPAPHRVYADWDLNSSALWYVRQRDPHASLALDGRVDRYSREQITASLIVDSSADRNQVRAAWDRVYSTATYAVLWSGSPLIPVLEEKGWTVLGQAPAPKSPRPYHWVALAAPVSR